ncbi:MAG: helix-turn-helix domain-containing protein [Muribaculaceae bacterium]
MKYSKIFIIILFVALLAVAFSIFGQSKSYEVFVGSNSADLIDKGRHYLFERQMPDSALTCFSIVANRYNPAMSPKDQAMVVEAYNRMWYLYFFVYFNYTDASVCLNKAAEISDGAGLNRERVDLNYGCMYMMLNEQSPDTALSRLAADYMVKAFTEANEVDNEDVRQYAMANLLSLKSTDSIVGDISAEWEEFNHQTQDKGSFIFVFNTLIYNLLSDIDAQRYDAALDSLDAALSTYHYSGDEIRCKYELMRLKAKVYYLMGDLSQCLATMHELERLTMQDGLTDYRLEVYRLLADYLKVAGREAESYDYKVKNLVLKDSILNYRQLTNINELRFLGEIKDMQVELTRARYRQKITTYGLVGTVFVVLLSVVFVIILYNRNRKLNESNRSLYMKNEELLRREATDMQADDSGDKVGVAKYSGSTIDVDSKERIYEQVKALLRTSEELYSDEFCIALLATLVDVKEKILSQVINELWGGNFSSLVNYYRINEACRRIHNEELYGNYTIEAIGNSVGFKSRSTFIAAFKKQTGLTPSEYKKQAKVDN